jgi:hypothetical protein
MHGLWLVVIVRIVILFSRREPIPNPGGSVRAADGQAGEGIILSGLLLSQLTLLKYHENFWSQVLQIPTYFCESKLNQKYVSGSWGSKCHNRAKKYMKSSFLFQYLLNIAKLLKSYR